MNDPRIDKIRKDYALGPSDVWELPQKHGTYLIKHSAIEAIAVAAGITFEMPTILEADSANGIAVLIARGFLGERSEWSVGEASPKNIKVAYPWAMAEKRAKDRVVLKLVGLHGLVYSQDEMSEDGAEDEPYPDPPRRPSGKPETGWREDGARTPHSLNKSKVWQDEFMREINEIQSLPMLEKFRSAWSKKAKDDRWPPDWKDYAGDEIQKHKDSILASMSPENLALQPIRDTLQASLRASVQRPLDDDDTFGGI